MNQGTHWEDRKADVVFNQLTQSVNVCNSESSISYNLFSPPFQGSASNGNSANQITVGTWNVNGWNAATNENIIFKVSAISKLELSIIILTETHCMKNDVINFKNYEIFQYNRSKISRFANKGSGGLCI